MSVLDHHSAEDAAETPRLLSIKQASRILGLGRTNLYAMMASGRIRSVTAGRRRFVPREAIEEFIASLPAEYRRLA
jgi:excisionase family DNA binding protein